MFSKGIRCKNGSENNDHESPVFSLGPEDARFDSDWSPCSATSLCGAGELQNKLYSFVQVAPNRKKKCGFQNQV